MYGLWLIKIWVWAFWVEEGNLQATGFHSEGVQGLDQKDKMGWLEQKREKNLLKTLPIWPVGFFQEINSPVRQAMARNRWSASFFLSVQSMTIHRMPITVISGKSFYAAQESWTRDYSWWVNVKLIVFYAAGKSKCALGRRVRRVIDESLRSYPPSPLLLPHAPPEDCIDVFNPQIRGFFAINFKS
jgi:hypothetical protein